MTNRQFRIWDKENGSWFELTYRAYEGEIDELLLSPSGDLIRRTANGIVHESMFRGRIIVCFSTGLTDKNGVEIWEDDLVSFAGETWIVKWSASQAAFTLFSLAPVAMSNYIASAGVPIRSFNWIDDGKSGYLRLQKRSAPIEIVGNLHVNPELLPQSV